MKVFHAMLRSLNVIIQKGWGCEDSSWVLLRNKFTVGRMATKPNVLNDWLYTLGLLKVDLPLSQTSLKLLCCHVCLFLGENQRPSSHWTFWSLSPALSGTVSWYPSQADHPIRLFLWYLLGVGYRSWYKAWHIVNSIIMVDTTGR